MAGLKKKRRIQMLVLGAVLLAASAVLVSVAFRDAIVFFFSPTELMAEERRPDQLLRVGGLVVEGSWQRGSGETNVFEVTDGNGVVEIAFTGVLPDLFREGQGIVAEGYLKGGRFEASEVLAKHDENYMPKEVADALKEQGHFRDGAE
ncbi:MAG: cytochrome c maturation protein CcmE [Pseudomonadota bacterium]